jgi:hypothetical protein
MSLIEKFNTAKKWSSKAFAAVIISAIMSFMIVAILLAVMLPVLNGIINSTPAIDVNSSLNATQISLSSTIASSYGLLVIVLLLLAALAIIVVIGLFQYFVGGMSGTRQ